MVDRSNESLSAMMDGEAEEFELRRTLDRLDGEPELKEKWQRYHMIGAVMRHEEVAAPEFDISQQVMNALQEEPEYHLQPERSENRGKFVTWLKPLSSMAVAASVTAVVIFGVQRVNLESETGLASTAPQYTLPRAPVSRDFIPAQFGSRTLVQRSAGAEPEIIRLSQGLERYLDQHKHMLSQQESRWQTAWLPKGFKGLKRDIMPHSEVQVFSNGRNSFTVCVEDYGHQTVPEGAAQSGKMVAVGKRQGDYFITVVGDVPLMIAERIATSVRPK